MHRTIQGIPIGELDPTWRFASELRKELIPRELLFKGGSDEMDDNQLAFTRLGDFDQNGTEDLALVGVYENRRGERGNFVLILTRTAAGAWQKLFITALPGRAGFAALAQRSDDLEVWWCMSCDHFSTLVWDSQRAEFAWRKPEQ